MTVEILSDEQTRSISRKWREKGRSINDQIWHTEDESDSSTLVDKLDNCGIAYLIDFLQVDTETVEKFLLNDSCAWNEVGRKQSYIDIRADSKLFWEKINQIFPDLLNPDDTEFLIKSGGALAVLGFMNTIDTIGGENSSVIQSLAINAHAFK